MKSFSRKNEFLVACQPQKMWLNSHTVGTFLACPKKSSTKEGPPRGLRVKVDSVCGKNFIFMLELSIPEKFFPCLHLTFETSSSMGTLLETNTKLARR
jgi:hypothetical protein